MISAYVREKKRRIFPSFEVQNENNQIIFPKTESEVPVFFLFLCDSF